MPKCIETQLKILELSLGDFAKAMKVDYATAWRWTNSKMLPHPSRVTELAKVLQLPVETLVLDLFGPDTLSEIVDGEPALVSEETS